MEEWQRPKKFEVKKKNPENTVKGSEWNYKLIRRESSMPYQQ
jgi:hypothetical protein